MTNTAQAVVEVTQSDRDAAAHIHAAQYGSATPGYQWILEGEQDDDVCVQTLARHRAFGKAEQRKADALIAERAVASWDDEARCCEFDDHRDQWSMQARAAFIIARLIRESGND